RGRGGRARYAGRRVLVRLAVEVSATQKARSAESGEFLSPNLATQGQAVRTLPHARRPPDTALAAVLAGRRPAGSDDHARDLSPALAAKAAPRPGLRLGGQARPPVRALSPLGEHLVGEVYAPLADVHPRTGDQLADLPLGHPAEAARQVATGLPD